ncbi:MAG: transposase [Phycisphaerales bacterium]|nr:transposase [Phycisphaerales bacterium]
MPDLHPDTDDVLAICARHDPPLRAGSCVLRRREAAAIVQSALLHFEGDRYNLVSWCVMPNHVHLLVTPSLRHALSDIVHSWKSFTSNTINRLLGRSGTLWEREGFDHLVRSEQDLVRLIGHVEQNPVAAGLCAEPREWEFSSCGAGFQPARHRLVDPRKLPFVDPTSRGELVHLYKPGGTYFLTWR